MMKSITVQTRLEEPVKKLDKHTPVFDANNQHNDKTTKEQQITWKDFQGLGWIFFEDVI